MDRRALSALALLFSGCAAGDVTARSEAVVGGTPSDDEAVVALLEWDRACAAAPSVGCSGVLVSPRVVLTAAHCVDPLLDAHQASVFFGADVGGPGERIAVVASRVDPRFDLARGDRDLALLLLAEPAPATPVTLVDHDASGIAVGADLRVAGFGVSEAGTDTEGVRRAGVMTLSAGDPFNLTSAPGPSMSCEGDSGGPVFAQLDGTEVLVAITSAGDRGCVESARNARVDERLDAFIRPTIAELEAIPRPSPPDLARLAGLCGERCADSTECPSGMSCDTASDGLRYCSLGAIGPGALEEACTSDAECGPRACVRLAAPDGCRCFDPCLEPPAVPDAGPPADPPTGCTISSQRQPGLAWLLALACLALEGRARRGARR